MKDELVEIRTPSGSMETFITHPEQDGPFPPVIVYMDVWGLREVLCDLARRIATVGYYVMVPDFYYRQGKVRFDFRNPDGKAISINRLSPADRDRVLATQAQLTDEMVMEDTGTILDFLHTTQTVKPSAVGSVGYCMGGRHVMQAAARYPDRFVASASLHGTTLISDNPDSPHHFVEKMRGEIYCGFAETDQYAPSSMIAELAGLMKKSPAAAYRYEIHPGALHGYSLPDRDIYHKRGAERDWELIFAMFNRQIPAYAGL